jgi:hypothetical protein
MKMRDGGAAIVAALLLTLALVSVASAHVVKQFGPYSVAMGWLHEPTYVGVENAVQVLAKDAKGAPVNDLQPGDLSVVISAAGQNSAVLPLQPSFDPDTGLGTPGEYTASIIPTQVGDYTFHLIGSIHGTAVDETVASSDQTFNSVVTGADVQFPVKLPALGDLSTLIQRVDGRVTAAGTTAAQAQQDATQARQGAIQAEQDAGLAQQAAAKSSDDAGRTLLVGVLVGTLGMVFGLAGLAVALRATRRRP